MTQLFGPNNFASTLGADVTGSDTLLSLSSYSGLPSPGPGEFFLLTLYALSGVTETNHEIVKVTARSGGACTVVRAQEGTTARVWQAGTAIAHRATAGTMSKFSQGGFVGQMICLAVATTPSGWLACDGTVYNIADYPALGALLGSLYGGNGTTTFAVPDMRDRAAVGKSGTKTIASSGGSASVTLAEANLPAHSHTASFSGATGTASVAIPAKSDAFSGNIPGTDKVLSLGATVSDDANIYYTGDGDTTLKPFNVNLPASSGTVSVNYTGSGTAVTVQNPYVAVNWVICAQGLALS